MAKKQRKRVVFKSVTKVPGHVLGKPSDVEMEIGKPVSLPADYADHVIALRMAKPYKQGAAEKAVAKDTPSTQDTGGAALETAKALVDSITAQMEGLDEADPKWAALSEQLDEAATAQAALEGV